MSIESDFGELRRKHFLAAIERINQSGVPKGLESRFYDLVFEGKTYPPKLVVAYAFQIAFDRKILNADFKGGLESKAFAVLAREGFEIIDKEQIKIKKLLTGFVRNALLISQDRDRASLKTVDYNGEEYHDTSLKVSFGKGNFTDVPWMSFLAHGQSVQEGIYPVILFSRKGKEQNLEVCFGISETRAPSARWKPSSISGLKTSQAGKYSQSLVYRAFSIQNEGDLVGKYGEIVEALDHVIEKFHEQLGDQEVEEASAKGYWAFQANPKRYKIVDCLRNEDLSTWTVSSHGSSMKVGDKVILWVTGEKSGVYALLELTSTPFLGKDGEVEQRYWTDEGDNLETERVGVSIEANFAENPLTKEELEKQDWFRDRKFGKPGVMGTNFEATREMYEELKAYAEEREQSDQLGFNEVKKLFDPEDVNALIQAIRLVVGRLDIDSEDRRVVFSCRRNTLQFTSGQRYCLALKKENGRSYFGLISKEPMSPNIERFDGSTPATYSKIFNRSEIAQCMDQVVEQAAIELGRSELSSYRKYDDAAFRRAVFKDLVDSKDVSMKNAIPLKSLNTIFYGPPGTGKTKHATDLMDQFRKEYRVQGAVNIDSFIRDLAWWEVFALAINDLGGSKVSVSQIEEHRFMAAKLSSGTNNSLRQTIWGNLQAHTSPESQTVKVTRRLEPFIFDKDENSRWSLTPNWKEEMAGVLESLKSVVEGKAEVPSNTRFITFHQSYAYEDFIEGIKPKLQPAGGVSYDVKPGSFRSFCDQARRDRENSYLFVIDEINRGNISKIFGELITLIEESKREGKKHCVPVRLQYSEDEFCVPENVHIVGTMNTADRSIASLDLALRRRFNFVALYPDEEMVRDVGGVELKSVFTAVNNRIRALIGDDYQIGHTFFLNLDDVSDLKEVWFGRILPLLQEYFYGDYDRLLAVVPSFVHSQEVALQFDDEKKKNVFRLKTEKDFQDDRDFITAVNKLK